MRTAKFPSLYTDTLRQISCFSCCSFLDYCRLIRFEDYQLLLPEMWGSAACLRSLLTPGGNASVTYELCLSACLFEMRWNMEILLGLNPPSICQKGSAVDPVAGACVRTVRSSQGHSNTIQSPGPRTRRQACHSYPRPPAEVTS